MAIEPSVALSISALYDGNLLDDQFSQGSVIFPNLWASFTNLSVIALVRLTGCLSEHLTVGQVSGQALVPELVPELVLVIVTDSRRQGSCTAYTAILCLRRYGRPVLPPDWSASGLDAVGRGSEGALIGCVTCQNVRVMATIPFFSTF
jgi:hypothetical protein